MSARRKATAVVDLTLMGEFDVDTTSLVRLAEEAIEHLELGEVELSLVLCGDAFIRELNRDYRDKDTPTDVLSFSQREGEDADFEDPVLGDVIISVETARRQAESLGHELRQELVVLMVHGLLHLLGHDHEEPEERKRMQRAESGLLSQLEWDSRSGLIGRIGP